MTAQRLLAPAAPYDIFGESVGLFAADQEVADLAHTALGAFSKRESETSIAKFHIRRHDRHSPVVRGRQLHSGSLMVTADRHKLITASLATLPWQIHIDAFGRDAEYVHYYLFEPLLHMVLKRRGLAHWHGAAVQRGGRDILIVGTSGSGKSTTALSLLSNGYAYVADDELFLDSRDGVVRAQSAERFLHFTAATADLVPALPPRSELPLVPRGQGKKFRLTAAVFPPATPAGEIRCLLFPSVRSGATTHCEPVSQSETLRRLLTHPPKEYPAVVADPTAVKRQFDTCASLATQAAAYDVVLGRDLDRLPRLVDELLP